MVLPPAAAVLPLAHGQDLTYGQWRAQMRDDAAAGHLTTDGAYGQTRALGCGRAAGGGGGAAGGGGGGAAGGGGGGAAGVVPRQLGEASSGEEEASGGSSPSAPAPSEPMCASGTLYYNGTPNPYPTPTPSPNTNQVRERHALLLAPLYEHHGRLPAL